MPSSQTLLSHDFRIDRQHLMENFLEAAIQSVDPELTTIEDAMHELGFEIRVSDEGDILGLASNGFGYASDKEHQLLQAIAPFVEPGSYINMIWETEELFQWYFDGEKYHTLNVRIVGQPKRKEVMAQAFYTDLGESPQVVDDKGNDWTLDRYGVWTLSPSGKYQVVETFDNLQDLIDAWGEIPLRKIEPVVLP